MKKGYEKSINKSYVVLFQNRWIKQKGRVYREKGHRYVSIVARQPLWCMKMESINATGKKKTNTCMWTHFSSVFLEYLVYLLIDTMKTNNQMDDHFYKILSNHNTR